MGFWKKLFGGGDEEEAPAKEAVKEDARFKNRNRGGRERPPLADAPPPGHTIDDALALREGGDAKAARAMFVEIDRGGGLRTVLRAAAALEAGDDDEVEELMSVVRGEASGWKLLLQVSAALEAGELANEYVERAKGEGAPGWAIAWARATSSDDKTRREGLVELLFADAPLARSVAARDLHADGVVADPEAAPRYAAFAHGRDSIRRFGAGLVEKVVSRARGAR